MTGDSRVVNQDPSPKKYTPLQIVLIAAIVIGVAIYQSQHRPAATAPARATAATQSYTPAQVQSSGTSALEEAWRAHRSGITVEGSGVVKKVLPDDNEGLRHERFLVDVPGGPTILIAHNIDIAERVPLSKGDRIEFRGEYIWNEQGGLVHWTHRDPKHHHPDGWLRVGDKSYR